MVDALIHLRVPAQTKARWVRESRAAGMRLTDWITKKVEGHMVTLYVYSTETNEVVARIHGNGNDACEAKMTELNYDNNGDYGATYSPAFGSTDGLIDNDKAVDYDA